MAHIGSLRLNVLPIPSHSWGQKALRLRKFIRLFNRYLLSISYVPGTVTRTEDTMNKTQVSAVAVLPSRRGDN